MVKFKAELSDDERRQIGNIDVDFQPINFHIVENDIPGDVNRIMINY